MGLLNVHFALMSPISPFVVQYWRSFEELERFARDPASLHLPVWTEFNRRVRDSGDVGIYHETYRVAPGTQEAIYGNMPEWGLAKATGGARPVGTAARTAAVRFGVRPDDEAPVEGY